MLLLYNTGIRLYFLTIWIVSAFNQKAKSWLSGRKNSSFTKYNNSIWFHFASLGEFEQGRSVLQQVRTLFPEKKIVITFFSPSGYEVRKNTPLADAVYYLPLDTAHNAKRFIDAIQPEMAIFTKYEYWYHFFNETHKRNIPLYIISGIFRPGQVFFKWYGRLHREILSFVTHFFVQDDASKQLLKGINITNATVSGDTRFDRVWANAQSLKSLPEISAFKNSSKVFIAGSTWPPDEKLVTTLINQYLLWKFIIAPHEVGEEKIVNLQNLLPEGSFIRYSQIKNGETQLNSFRVLIIDNIGMLSSLYQYSDIAYIGGGFGAGIHNTLEAAAFGLPVIFGPNYSRFKEAHDLVELKAGFSIANEAELKAITDTLINDDLFYNKAALNSANYAKTNTGATGIIMKEIFKID